MLRPWLVKSRRGRPAKSFAAWRITRRHNFVRSARHSCRRTGEVRAGVIRLSWGCVAAMALALTACSMTPPGELSTREAVAPVPPDGLIVGVVVVVRTPSVDWSMARFPVSLKYDHQSGASGELLLGREMHPPYTPL